jgi:predicted GNAT family N-acyltransferase
MYHLLNAKLPSQRDACHAIRKAEIFDKRPNKGSYNSSHPDDRNPDKHLMVLINNNDTVVGTCRLDHVSGKPDIIIRLVAITRKWQGRGLGRRMMEEAFLIAEAHGKSLMHVNAAADAVGFYERLGFDRNDWNPSDNGRSATNIQMTKTITG